jgi:hypothetical protein
VLASLKRCPDTNLFQTAPLPIVRLVLTLTFNSLIWNLVSRANIETRDWSQKAADNSVRRTRICHNLDSKKAAPEGGLLFCSKRPA